MKLDEVQGPNPEILVQGIGRYQLSQAVDNVRGKLEDLLKRANGPITFENWTRIKSLLDRQTLQAFIYAIEDALRQMH